MFPGITQWVMSRTRGSVARAAPMAFGLTSTPLYKWLKFSRKILLFVLQRHPQAIVSKPNKEEVKYYIEAIGAKYPVLKDYKVWAAADGLKVPLQQSTDYFKQNKNYNGWVGSTYINSVLVFAPDGKIRIATLNCPGSWHDSTIAEYGVYSKMEEIYDRHQARVVVDSAFSLATKDFMIKSSQQDPIDRGPEGVLVNRNATSVRQLSEWGMRMIQGSFPRLKDNMILEDFGDRKIIMNLVVALYNFQTSAVGINQILNTFTSKTKGFYSYGFTMSYTDNDQHHQQGDVPETANALFQF